MSHYPIGVQRIKKRTPGWGRGDPLLELGFGKLVAFLQTISGIFGSGGPSVSVYTVYTVYTGVSIIYTILSDFGVYTVSRIYTILEDFGGVYTLFFQVPGAVYTVFSGFEKKNHDFEGF